MNCQNCDAPVLVSDEHCEKCGAKLLRQRVFLGLPKSEEFALTTEEPAQLADEPEASEEGSAGDFPPRAETFAAAPLTSFHEETFAAPIWGGFFRRVGAFLIDIAMILLMFGLMAAMSYVGYKIGLAAHERTINWANSGPLMSFMTFAWMALTTIYFVMFHGMEGRTVGKWLLGLRVVGVDQRPISYRRALLRWIGTVGLGGASLGLAFLWILWQREKRGWHDFLARTWVVRE